MPVQRPPEWEPEPLRVPVEPPARRAPSTVEIDAEVDPDQTPRVRSDREGSHVIVIDIA